MLAITVWAIGQIGKHTPEHAKAIAASNILPKLLEVHTHFFYITVNCTNLYHLSIINFQFYNDPNSSEDLRAKCHMTLKQVLQRCLYIEALEPLVHDAPPNILKYVLGQFSKVSDTLIF